MPNDRRDWSHLEVEAIVADYFEMFAKELRGEPYDKTAHRRSLREQLDRRTDGSIEYKHQNISAVLLDLGHPYIEGYKPHRNYQDLLYEVVRARLADALGLTRLIEREVDAQAVAPGVEDILEREVRPPHPKDGVDRVRDRPALPPPRVDYLLREARNASLGRAGEEFVVQFEQTRLLREGKDTLAADVEQVSVTRGDHEGFDVLSFEPDGAERFIEVKTTGFGQMTRFFASRNQVDVSSREANRYHLYRLFRFRKDPRLFVLSGAIETTCELRAAEYEGRPRR